MKLLDVTRTPQTEQSSHWKESILFWMDRTAIERTPLQCAVAAMRAGYSMFAVQDGGWCATSAMSSAA